MKSQKIPLQFHLVKSITIGCFLFTIGMSSSTYALSTKDIFLSQKDLSPSFNTIVTRVRDIEPVCTYWSAQWERGIPRDSVKAILYTALKESNCIVEEINLFKLALFRGLLWHYLHQMEVDTGFVKADVIANALRTKYPHNFEGAWLKGINLVKAAHLFTGFHVLDSLNTSKGNLPDNFYRDYAQLSALSFLPEGVDLLDTPIVLYSGTNVPGTIQLTVDDGLPVSNTWEVISSPDAPRVLPGFVFGVDFSLKKPPALVLPHPRDKHTYTLTLPETRKNDIPRPLFFNPDDPPQKMAMKIFVENETGGTTLDQYIYDIVNNRYDEIKTMNIMQDKKTLALKCLRRSVVRGVPDRYTSYVVFDRYLDPRLPQFYSPPAQKKEDQPIKLRYIVAMETAKDVEEKAEVLFQDVLGKFKK